MPNGSRRSRPPPDVAAERAEMAVIGTENGHTIVYGSAGSGWRTGRILAAETGPRAVEAGTIVDVAAVLTG